uniref:Uncharacterized protein n=1 Tax=Rhizophora mucronata TaxID=61149 RepID=A0A2P2NVJ7_RHIMU
MFWSAGNVVLRYLSLYALRKGSFPTATYLMSTPFVDI